MSRKLITVDIIISNECSHFHASAIAYLLKKLRIEYRKLADTAKRYRVHCAGHGSFKDHRFNSPPAPITFDKYAQQLVTSSVGFLV